MARQKKFRARKIDETVPIKIRDVESELPKPIGIFGTLSNSVIVNNTFVGIPTPIYIKGDNNIVLNNRAYR